MKTVIFLNLIKHNERVQQDWMCGGPGRLDSFRGE